MSGDPVDLGHGHTMRYTVWKPDRALNPQYADVPDIDPVGVIIDHPRVDNPDVACSGHVTFDSDAARRVFPNNPRWTVESWDPLTISPSVLCSCGDHGYIREGRWVSA